MTLLNILLGLNFILVMAVFYVMDKRIKIANSRVDTCGERIEVLHKKVDIAYHLTTGKDLDTYGERNEIN